MMTTIVPSSMRIARVRRVYYHNLGLIYLHFDSKEARVVRCMGA